MTALETTSENFPQAAREALTRETLQNRLSTLHFGSALHRQAAKDDLPEFEAYKAQAQAVKNHTLQHLDLYLERFIEKASACGTQVHWAGTAEEARAIILDLCRKAGAKTVAKAKSMVSEEIELGAALEAEGIRPVETDLGEYIVQLRGEKPSHIIGPAMHLNRHDIADTFREHHTHLAPDRPLEEPQDMVREARAMLREAFLNADVGISGANFLVAETGSIVLVTNEGNADLSISLPKIHIALTGIEKVIPTLEDASVFLRLLARSGTGQEITAYSSFITGPKRQADADGPEDMHLVLLDNGRSNVLQTEFQDMLRCIRCSACLNACPVYSSVGGHAYGSVYSGPMGAVLSPLLAGIEGTAHLPNASSFCGKCEEVCPMSIPLPAMMRAWRVREFERRLSPRPMRWGLGLWAFLAKRPGLYQAALGLANGALRLMGGRAGWIRRAPPPAGGWTRTRDLRAPGGQTFQAAWAKAQAEKNR